ASRASPRHAYAQMREPAPSRMMRPGPAAQQTKIGPSQHTPAASLQTPKNAGASSRTAVSPPTGQRDNARRTVGLAPGSTQRQLSPAERQRLAEARRAPFLRSPVFAGTSGGAATAAASRATFRGAFAESGFARDPRHHHRFGFVLGFIGPVFWPYAYND